MPLYAMDLLCFFLSHTVLNKLQPSKAPHPALAPGKKASNDAFIFAVLALSVLHKNVGRMAEA